MKLSRFYYLYLWLFFSGLLATSVAAAVFLGYWQKLFQLDRTYISFFIVFVFSVGWFYSLTDIIWLTRFVSRDEIPDQIDFENAAAVKDERNHFFTKILPALGFMGTLVGMLILLDAFSPLIEAGQELSNLRSYLLGIIGGLSTAALTTVIGLGGYIILEFFHLIFRHAYLKFLAKAERGKNETETG